MKLSKEVFKHNWLIEEIGLFFLRHNYGYKKGFVDGMERSDYFRGMADGQEQAFEYFCKEVIPDILNRRKKEKKK